MRRQISGAKVSCSSIGLQFVVLSFFHAVFSRHTGRIGIAPTPKIAPTPNAPTPNARDEYDDANAQRMRSLNRASAEGSIEKLRLQPETAKGVVCRTLLSMAVAPLLDASLAASSKAACNSLQYV